MSLKKLFSREKNGNGGFSKSSTTFLSFLNNSIKKDFGSFSFLDEKNRNLEPSKRSRLVPFFNYWPGWRYNGQDAYIMIETVIGSVPGTANFLAKSLAF